MNEHIYSELKNNYYKCRPNTWTCQDKRVPITAPSRWHSQYKKKKNRSRTTTRSSSSLKSLLVNDYVASLHQRLFRQTIITISTVSTIEPQQQSSPTTRVLGPQQPPHVHVFHTQSLLFIFGFLFFPCWWVGGFYLKLEYALEEKQDEEMAVHSSLLANGKTYCKTLPSSPYEPVIEYYLASTFYKWNRIMSIMSILLLVFMIILLIWYFLKYY